MSKNLYADTDRLSLSKVRHNWQHWRNTRRTPQFVALLTPRTTFSTGSL